MVPGARGSLLNKSVQLLEVIVFVLLNLAGGQSAIMKVAEVLML